MKSILLIARCVSGLLIGLVLNASWVLGQSTSLLRIHTIEVVPGAPTQFLFADQGTGATNYTLQFSSDVGSGASWSNVTGAAISALGGGNFRVAAPESQTSSGFYRVRGNGGAVIVSFATTAFQTTEGGTIAVTINFNAAFFGTIHYTVNGSAKSGDFIPLSGEVLVQGTSAVIPVTLTDNLSIGELKYLSLRLEAGPGYRLGTARQTTITIDENDADWQGSFVTGKASVGFVLRMQRSALGDAAALRNGGFGFFPTNEVPATVILAENNFHATVAGIPVSANATLLNSAMSMLFELNAANGRTNQSVSPTLIQGEATLINLIPGREYLNSTNRGTFVLLKSPVRPSTNEVQLVTQP